MTPAVKAFGLSSYRMREAVRVGGLCQAYLAESLEAPGMGPLIIKQLLPAFASDGQIAARWLEQAEANAALDHPGCLRVIDWGWADGTGHIVVPQIPGTSLKQLIRGLRSTQRDVPPEVAVYIVKEVLNALAYAHDYVPPMCHLDVSPYSVLIRPDATLLVTEFGMWSALPVMDAARVRFERGRAHYLSPEIARSQPADVRSDVFSAGVMLYELLLGERPFSGTTQLVVAMAIAEGRRKPVVDHSRAARLSPELCAVVEHMLAHDPGQRFQTARAALNALSAACAEDPHARGKLAALVPHAALPERGAPAEQVAQAARAQVKTAFFRGRAGKGGAAAGAGAAPASGGPARPTLRAQPGLEAPPPMWAVMETPPRAPGEHSTARVRAVKPGANSELAPPPVLSIPHSAEPRTAKLSSVPEAVLSVPPAVSLAPPPMVGPSHPSFANAGPAESVAPPPMLPAPASLPIASPPTAASAAPPRVPAGPVPWTPGLGPSALSVDIPPFISPSLPSRDALPRPEPAMARAVSEPPKSVAERLDSGPLPVLRFEPLAPTQEPGRWRDPSHTLFQMKRYAEGETPRQGSRVPLPVAVALAVVFGFAVVAGGYLLFRLST